MSGYKVPEKLVHPGDICGVNRGMKQGGCPDAVLQYLSRIRDRKCLSNKTRHNKFTSKGSESSNLQATAEPSLQHTKTKKGLAIHHFGDLNFNFR
eukprot:4557127-Amphidinium_carterae.1